jgi:hypothetical protein
MARPLVEVDADVGLEHPKGGPDEPDHTVRMGTGTPSFHQVAKGGDLGDAAVQDTRLDGQELHGAGQRVEPMDTRAALSCTLALEVPDDPTHLEQ